MKKLFYWLFAIALIIALGVSECKRHNPAPNLDSYEVIDSITAKVEKADTAPVVRDSVVIRYQYVKVPVTPPPQFGEGSASPADTDTLAKARINVVATDNDSVQLAIPITQTKYETDEYRAYVSGYNARLDSIFTKSQNTVVRIRAPAPKAKRFSVGLQVGYGMTPKGFQPYAGLGVSVNLFSF